MPTSITFRRILKYEFYDNLPEDVRQYAFASLVKRASELDEYPEYLYLKSYIKDAIALEEKYLRSKGISIQNTTGKTILCQAMDLADENRYRVTDIIDSLNIYSKEKLQEIFLRTIKSEVRVKDLRKLVHLKTLSVPGYEELHYDKMKIKDLLIALLKPFKQCQNRVSKYDEQYLHGFQQKLFTQRRWKDRSC